MITENNIYQELFLYILERISLTLFWMEKNIHKTTLLNLLNNTIDLTKSSVILCLYIKK